MIKKKLIKAIVISLSIGASSQSFTASASDEVWNAYNDSQCQQTLTGMNTAIEQKRKEADAIRETTTTKPTDAIDKMKACVDGIGAVFRQGLQLPDVDGLLAGVADRACNYVTTTMVNNPVSQAVNNFSISDPHGIVSYNPKLSVASNGGKFEKKEIQVYERNVSGDIWRGVTGSIPGSSDLWKKARVKTGNYKFGVN